MKCYQFEAHLKYDYATLHETHRAKLLSYNKSLAEQFNYEIKDRSMSQWALDGCTMKYPH